MIVHIRETYTAVASHFSAGQKGTPVVVFGVHLSLKGPALLIKPGLQGQIFGITPQQGHRRMSVGIIKSRDKQLAGTVIDLAILFCSILRSTIPYIVNISPFYTHPLLGFKIEILIKKINLGYKHKNPFFPEATDLYTSLPFL